VYREALKLARCPPSSRCDRPLVTSNAVLTELPPVAMLRFLTRADGEAGAKGAAGEGMSTAREGGGAGGMVGAAAPIRTQSLRPNREKTTTATSHPWSRRRRTCRLSSPTECVNIPLSVTSLSTQPMGSLVAAEPAAADVAEDNK
jgi:hypothetical protein